MLAIGAAALGAASPQAPAATNQSKPSAALLRAVMGDLASIRRSEASFREVKRIARLTEPLISTGRLIYVRPNYLAMLTEAPRREKLVVDGDRLYLAEGDAAAHVIDLAAHPAIGALVEAIRGTLAGDIAELRKNFSVSVIGTPARWRLVLIPRVPAIAHLLRTITFEGKGSGVRRLTAIETNGDEMGMSIGPTS